MRRSAEGVARIQDNRNSEALLRVYLFPAISSGPEILAIPRASFHSLSSPNSRTHLSRYKLARDSPRTFKTPAASSIRRSDLARFDPSRLEWIKSSALATKRET